MENLKKRNMENLEKKIIRVKKRRVENTLHNEEIDKKINDLKKLKRNDEYDQTDDCDCDRDELKLAENFFNLENHEGYALVEDDFNDFIAFKSFEKEFFEKFDVISVSVDAYFTVELGGYKFRDVEDVNICLEDLRNYIIQALYNKGVVAQKNELNDLDLIFDLDRILESFEGKITSKDVTDFDFSDGGRTDVKYKLNFCVIFQKNVVTLNSESSPKNVV